MAMFDDVLVSYLLKTDDLGEKSNAFYALKRVESSILTHHRVAALSEIETQIRELGLEYRGAGSVKGYTSRAPRGMRDVWYYNDDYGEGLVYTEPQFGGADWLYLTYYVR
ncbi:hypothetical protein [Muribaculum intestinale]|uniref:hypothetical protein n=1 Tax=Muribaculum intestinale TaxID=1796646 RepID=UPI0025B6935C|nr:hypothetical protein [Muribaculum intestinale]